MYFSCSIDIYPSVLLNVLYNTKNFKDLDIHNIVSIVFKVQIKYIEAGLYYVITIYIHVFSSYQCLNTLTQILYSHHKCFILFYLC